MTTPLKSQRRRKIRKKSRRVRYEKYLVLARIANNPVNAVIRAVYQYPIFGLLR